jgi:hypothetical protein
MGARPYWLEMPTVTDNDDPGRLRPKYAASSRAVLVHDKDKIYVFFEDETARTDVESHRDVRRFSAKEVEELERKRPYLRFLTSDAVSAARGSQGTGRGVVLLGDVFARLAKTFGIAECEPCKGRRERLNKIALWRWSRP